MNLFYLFCEWFCIFLKSNPAPPPQKNPTTTKNPKPKMTQQISSSISEFHLGEAWKTFQLGLGIKTLTLGKRKQT